MCVPIGRNIKCRDPVRLSLFFFFCSVPGSNNLSEHLEVLIPRSARFIAASVGTDKEVGLNLGFSEPCFLECFGRRSTRVEDQGKANQKQALAF